MRKSFIRIMALGVLVCLLMLSACESLSSQEKNNLKDYSVTKIELATSRYSGKVDDVIFLSSNPKPSEISNLEKIYATAYADKNILNRETGLEKAIRWVISDTDVVSVSSGTLVYKGDKLKLKVNIKESVVADGVYEIHAENFDGSVKSKSIKVVIGFPIEALTRLSLNSSVSYSIVDTLKVESGVEATQAEKMLYLKALTFNDKAFQVDFNNNIRWVSSDPDVISVESEGNAEMDTVVSARLDFKKEGVVEIYAETNDGRVQSNSITIAYGNQFNKEVLATDFAAKYVLDHLRYKTKDSGYLLTDLRHRKTFFMNGNTMKIGYSKFTDTSTVETTSTVFSDDEATIKGIIETYTESFSNIRFSFAIKIKCIPDSKYTSYEIISTNYEMPEYIIKDVDIED